MIPKLRQHPGTVYVNSLLASLNARKSLRNWDNSEPTSLDRDGDGRQGGRGTSIVFPIPMTLTGATSAANMDTNAYAHSNTPTDVAPFSSMTKQTGSFTTDGGFSTHKDLRSTSMAVSLTARTSTTLDEREKISREGETRTDA